MMGEIPDELIIQARDREGGLAGSWVRLTLATRRKNDFGVVLGPADREGRLVATRQEVLDQIDETRDFFPMDYTGLADWDGTIRVSVMNRDDVSRTLSAFEMWGKALGVRSPQHLDQLKAFGRLLQSREREELHVRVQARPPEVARIEQVISHA
jgi:hypothetical protein